MNNITLPSNSAAINYKGAAAQIKNAYNPLRYASQSSVASSIKLPSLLSFSAIGAALTSLLGIKTNKQKEAEAIYARIASANATQELIVGLNKKIPGLCDFAGVKRKEFTQSNNDSKALSSYSQKNLVKILANEENKKIILDKLSDIERINLEFIKYIAHENNTDFQDFVERVNKINMKKMNKGYVMAIFQQLFNERIAGIKQAEEQGILSRLDNVDKDYLTKKMTEYKRMKATKKCELYQQIVPKIDWLEDKNVAEILKRMLFEEHKISIIEVDEILKSYNVKEPKQSENNGRNLYAFLDLIEDKDVANYLKICFASGQNVVDIKDIEDYKKGKKLRETFLKLISSINFSAPSDKKVV